MMRTSYSLLFIKQEDVGRNAGDRLGICLPRIVND